MQCTTLDRVEENGIMVMRPKKQFDTLDKAIAVAKIENAKPEHLHKVVAYKCNICYKYHIGRNGKPLTVKERNKRQQEIKQSVEVKEAKHQHALDNLKVVGYIDLNKIKY